MVINISETFLGIGEEFFAGILEDETTKKPVVAAPVVTVTSAPIVADKPAVVAVEPVKEEVVPVEVIEEFTATEPYINDEKVAEVITEAVPEKVVESDAVNEVVPPTANDVPVVEPMLVGEVVPSVPAVVADSPVAAIVPAVTSAPVKATSEEEDGLIEGIVNTLILDDGDDGEI